MELNFEGTYSAEYLLEQYGFATKKSLGQNFLIDDFVLSDIATSALSDGENKYILEIGPGLGVLTQYLVANAGLVLSIELDKSLVQILKNRFSSSKNFDIEQADFLDEKINNDFLKNKFSQLGNKCINFDEKIKVVANLPYYITSPIITKLLCEMDTISDIFVLVQKEVAERICANPKHSEYGVFSILCQFYADTNLLFHVAPDCFDPAPKVYSSFIEIKKNDNYKNKLCKECNVNQDELQNELVHKFLDFIKFSFTHKRKTLINNLSAKYDKNLILENVSELNLDSKVRPEELSIENFIKLFNNLSYKNSNK